MSDLPSKEELVEAMKVAHARWRNRPHRDMYTAILDAILPLVMRGPVEALRDVDGVLDDWVCQYADDMVGDLSAARSAKRISENGGTLAYIGTARARARSVRQWAEKIGGG